MRALVVGLGLLASAVPLAAQSDSTARPAPARDGNRRDAAQHPAVLMGRVLTDSSERAIGGAEIAVPTLSVTVRTDSIGRFEITLPPGKHQVQLRRIGYRPLAATITFAEGDTLEGEFYLSRTLDKLERVLIRAMAMSPKIRDFDKRRQAGFGNFIGPEQMAKMVNRTTADALRTIPGPDVHRSTMSTAAWVAAGRGAIADGGYTVDRSDRSRGAPAGRCWSTVYVDNVAVFSALPGELLFDINSIPTEEISAMEYYSSAAVVPSEFPQKRNTCGVLVIWTKP